MKKTWTLLTGALLSVCLWLGMGQGMSLEARAQDVTLERGEQVAYEGYVTNYYYIDGELGYCLEPEKMPPEGGTYEADLLGNDSLLAKALYYVYGGPGYEDYLEKELPEDWRGKQEAYCFSHCMLSYIYGGSDAFRGLSEETKGAIRRCVEAVKGFPEIPEPELTFSRSKLTASFDPKEGRQQTETVTCTGDPANQVKIPLPEGVTLVNVTRGTSDQKQAVVRGGDRFYLWADVAYGNGGGFKTGDLYGQNRQKWRALVFEAGSGNQHIGSGTLVKAQVKPVSLQVSWVPEPELEIEKEADKSGKTYELGDLITYTIDVTQRIQEAVAKNVVITDTILTEGVKLQKTSVVLLDEENQVVPEAKITVRGNSYTIEAGEFLRGPESGQRYRVEYQVAITDASVIGREIENEVVVRADNAPEEKDRETVKVEEPEPEPEPEPEEPEPEPEPEPEEPAPQPSPRQEEPLPQAPKTGDEGNLMVLALLCILSCALLLICVKISCKAKYK